MMLDGNALAGRLADLFGDDQSDAASRCSGCGRTEPLARAAVFVSGMGMVARCRGCGDVLAVLVEADGRAWARLPGALRVTHADGVAPGM